MSADTTDTAAPPETALAEEAPPIAWAPASKADAIAFVQALIDAAFVRYDVLHGHLSPGEAEQRLAALQETLTAID